MTTVMSSCSRAMVHSAEIVYSALPSACRAITGRCGAAIAAPTATGRPWAIAPPVSVSTSCDGEPAVAAGKSGPLVLASSEMIAFSGTHDCPHCGLHGDRDTISASLAACVTFADPDDP